MARFNSSMTGMGDVTVAKAELLAIVEANRAAHWAVFQKACDKFRERAISKLNALADQVKRGDVPESLSVGLPIPEEHTDDYDRAIRMLRMHVGETVTLSEEACMRLVEDDWGWKQAFASNTSSYLVH